jgi:hypothetical protein
MPLSDILAPTRANLQVVAGDSYQRTVTVTESDGSAINLTGITGRAHVRARPGADLLAEFTVSIPTPANGQVVFSLTAEQTRALPIGALQWDLELDGGNTNTHTILAGTLTVVPDITIA